MPAPLSPTDKIAIIGLGYVGLPLAVEFGKSRPVLGFDVNTARIDALQQGHDSTLEVESEALTGASHLGFSSDPDDLRSCRIFIVTARFMLYSNAASCRCCWHGVKVQVGNVGCVEICRRFQRHAHRVVLREQ